jgi:hypothetical protein
MSSPAREQFENTMVQFIYSELETGITFASLALDSQTDEKRQRNRQNARKAFDTARHFLKQRAVEEIVAQPDLQERLNKLKQLLRELGEKVEE